MEQVFQSSRQYSNYGLLGLIEVVHFILAVESKLKKVVSWFWQKQEVCDDLSTSVLNIITKVSSLARLLATNLMKIEIGIFQTVLWPHVGHLIKASCLGACNTKLAPYLLWCGYIFCSWRYVFYFLRDPTIPLRWNVMRTYPWELLSACHHPQR